MKCGDGIGGGAVCGVEPAVRYGGGVAKCEAHAPAGRVVPDPARTLDGLRRAAGLPVNVVPAFRTVSDERAESSGKRVSAARRAAARGDTPKVSDRRSKMSR